MLVESLNAGKVPAPYAEKGLGGAPIELVFIDEAGGTAKQVSEYRDLVQRQNVDVVIGYISSGDCLAVAPLAEELKKLTIFFDCGTPRIFEDASYKYLFRTAAHAALVRAAPPLRGPAPPLRKPSDGHSARGELPQGIGDQLRVHSQPAATMLHRAVKRVADVQLMPNLLETDPVAFVAERSMSTDHE